MIPLLHARLGGRDEAPALLFLHGFLGDSEDWEDAFDRFSGRFRCIALDLPGHGRSLHLPESAYSFKGAAEHIAATLAALGVSRCSVLGYSMGGRIALDFALRHPGQVDALILESSSPGLAAEADRQTRAALDDARAAEIERDGLPVFLRSWYDQPLFASLQRHPELLARLRERRSGGDARGTARALRAFSAGRQTPRWDALPRLVPRTLLLAGALDSAYVEIARRAAPMIPHVRAVEVAEAGHAIHLEQPLAFFRELAHFLG